MQKADALNRMSNNTGATCPTNPCNCQGQSGNAKLQKQPLTTAQLPIMNPLFGHKIEQKAK